MKLTLTDDLSNSMTYDLNKIFEDGVQEGLIGWVAVEMFPCEHCQKFVLTGHFDEISDKQYCDPCWITKYTMPCSFCCDREKCMEHEYNLHSCPVCYGTGRIPTSKFKHHDKA